METEGRGRGGATLMPMYSQEYPTFLPNKYVYLKNACMYSLYWTIFSLI
jgi:hypothetical protein